MSTFNNDTTQLIAKIVTEIRRVGTWNTWHLENRSSRLIVKIGLEANIIATIPSIKGT